VKNLLIVVDCQNDFVDPSGALYVKGAEEKISKINELLNSGDFDLRIATRDWHPRQHVSFASRYKDRVKPFELVDTNYGKQVAWPDHCIAGTLGAQFYPKLNENRVDLTLNKGTANLIESYSAFELADGTKTPFFNMVEALNPEQIFVCGIALDFCVKQTALSCLKLTDKVIVLENAVQAVDESKRNDVLRDLSKAGIDWTVW
jgi:nicotinamidase/pyrazinamidase